MPITLEQVAYRLLPRVAAGRALADAEWTTLTRLAETLLAGTGLAVTPARVADNVERFLIRGQSQRAWRVRVLMTLVELAPLTHCGRTFGQLSTAERRALVQQRFVGGRGVWAICAKARLFVIMGAYGDAHAPAATGFVPMAERDRFAPRRVSSARRQLDVVASSVGAAE